MAACWINYIVNKILIDLISGKKFKFSEAVSESDSIAFVNLLITYLFKNYICSTRIINLESSGEQTLQVLYKGEKKNRMKIKNSQKCNTLHVSLNPLKICS